MATVYTFNTIHSASTLFPLIVVFTQPTGNNYTKHTHQFSSLLSVAEEDNGNRHRLPFSCSYCYCHCTFLSLSLSLPPMYICFYINTCMIV
ncbi:hypothetical protein RHGRI_023110 [Rhododendron griersonianum]|uniref:Uncharacterized protein n=1 Tax=Rhododendron griersonianum TaxID=479676 RepID=A0AAV6J5M8_9ERIC|nr:hypothetical protein RHGRI_023110 [Rhododendron griersonianum]KAG5535211.1 hypothetical protein RHGRI_023110 [Rhododendron griersonianum]KAG5535212.1 hypothetical protein RHGRI_023110 [Rhododendron griersonianum]KAG5535213.1 hypothetical protein RHGRI_023110 [Rhododendron griersonianum]KAG5535214.1 hypothetical protein RHGRI_023110 [Rhododendron griersonianum]